MYNNRKILIEVHRISMFLSLRIVRIYQCVFLLLFIFAIRYMAYYVSAAFYLLVIAFAMQEILFLIYKKTAKTDMTPHMPLLCNKYKYSPTRYFCNNLSSTVLYLLLLFVHFKYISELIYPAWITYTPLFLLVSSILLQLILYMLYRVKIHQNLMNGVF